MTKEPSKLEADARVRKQLAETQRENADKYRILQAQRLFDLFEEAHGRPPRTSHELAKFLENERKAGRLPAGPIDPKGG